MFKKILVANRGEIAVNIIQVCKKMGIKTVAIFSEADKNSLHVALADEKYCVGPVAAQKSYLNMNNILSVAIASNSDAIHPGYGFLSENYQFAKLCSENNITFIGPSPEVIEKMSNKISAKHLMHSIGVPVIKGYEIENDFSSLKKVAENIGYPVIIKSKNGGGGRGIRIVKKEDELEKSVFEVLQESKQYFNSENLYMEKYLEDASHIEIQIVADNHENVVCLGTRDCSIQISNQKIIEEAPDHKIEDSVRNNICSMCKDATRKVGYTNCGTLEFLIDKHGSFYFMEMNCRLQVERCVTEAITGFNLIETQIKIAAGEVLPWKQENVILNGHSVECRINLKRDVSSENFKFQITDFSVPETEGVIFKTAVQLDSYVPPFYDSMIGKLIAHGENRADAITKMQKALSAIIIKGIDTNIEIHKKIFKNSEFIDCTYSTNFMNNFSNTVPFERLNVYQKLDSLIDRGTFKEHDKSLESTNIIDFKHYNEKLIKAKEMSKNYEAVIYGEATINSFPCILVTMDGNFMMGSMGVVAGEKITRAFEFATEKKLPVVAVTVSGGARMQEGIFSLVQMVKTSAAVLKHSQKNLLYVAVITNPTLGGVSASFATLADIIISEKNAKFGFSGKRIVEEVIRKSLSDDFQSADFNLKHGMVDLVLDYDSIKDTLGKILRIHSM